MRGSGSSTDKGTMQARTALIALLFIIIGATASSNEAIVSSASAPGLEAALAYVTSVEGTHYGWWTGGPIPKTAPAWADDSPPPAATAVRASSCFCAGIPNLMLRVVGQPIPCLHPSSYCFELKLLRRTRMGDSYFLYLRRYFLIVVENLSRIFLFLITILMKFITFLR